MNRSLRMAAIASIAIHALVFVALMNLEYRPSRAGPMPVVNLSLRPIEGTPAADRSADAGADGGEIPDPVTEDPESLATAEKAAPEAAPEPAPRLDEEATESTREETPSLAREIVTAHEPPPVEPPPVEPPPVADEATPDETTAPAEELAAGLPPAPPMDERPRPDTAPPAPEPVASESTLPTPIEAEPAREPSTVTTAGPSERKVAVSSADSDDAPVASPLDEAQQEMLTRRLSRLAVNIDELGESADGWKHDGREYQAKLTRVTAQGDMDLDYILVDVTALGDGERLSAQLRMKRLAFSNFAQFVDRWDPEVQIHDDLIDGRFHSNSEIFVGNTSDAQPTFLGQVTTSYRSINTSNSRGRFRRDEIFLGGLETNVRRIDLPRDYLPFPDDGEAEDDQVIEFDEDTRIVFYDDGTYTAAPLGAENPAERKSLSDETTFLVGLRKVNLHVKGAVNGHVLVYSPEDIVIEGNLVYANDPREDPESDDYLGLVSDRSVEVAEPDVTGWGDLEINAAIYARGRFAVSHHIDSDDATLTIHGSLAAGSITATEPRFATVISFDERLENLRPPRFPMTDRYEVESWNDVWLVESLESE